MSSPLPTDRVPTNLPDPKRSEIFEPFGPEGRFFARCYPDIVCRSHSNTAYVIPSGNVPWARGWGDREADMLLFWVVLRRAWKHTFAIELRGREIAEAEDYFAILDRKATSLPLPRIEDARWALAEQSAARTPSTGLPTWSPPDGGAFPSAHVRLLAPVQITDNGPFWPMDDSRETVVVNRERGRP